MLSRKKPLQNKTPMKRTPMARGTAQLARSTKAMAPVGKRAKRTGQGKVAPTVEEAVWMSSAAAYGCIVCRTHYGAYVQAEVHHLLQGGRRRGHAWSIGLCAAHHRGGNDTGMFISRHPWLKRFEAAYGSEIKLLLQLRAALATAISLPILPGLSISENNFLLTPCKTIDVR